MKAFFASTRVSRLMLRPLTPASRSLSIFLGSKDPLVVIERVLISLWDLMSLTISSMSLLKRGSPPVKRILATPNEVNTERSLEICLVSNRDISYVATGHYLRFLWQRHSLLGHAVLWSLNTYEIPGTWSCTSPGERSEGSRVFYCACRQGVSS